MNRETRRRSWETEERHVEAHRVSDTWTARIFVVEPHNIIFVYLYVWLYVMYVFGTNLPYIGINWWMSYPQLCMDQLLFYTATKPPLQYLVENTVVQLLSLYRDPACVPYNHSEVKFPTREQIPQDRMHIIWFKDIVDTTDHNTGGIDHRIHGNQDGDFQKYGDLKLKSQCASSDPDLCGMVFW